MITCFGKGVKVIVQFRSKLDVRSNLNFHPAAGADQRSQVLGLREQREVAQRLVDNLRTGTLVHLDSGSHGDERTDPRTVRGRVP